MSGQESDIFPERLRFGIYFVALVVAVLLARCDSAAHSATRPVAARAAAHDVRSRWTE